MRAPCPALLAVVLSATGVRSETYTYRIEGVFTQESTTTPGLAGDSFVLRVVIDSETPGAPSLGGFLFSGGVGDVAIEGVPFRSGLPAFVSHDCCGDGTLQVGVDLGDSDFFIPFFTDLVLPEPATLTPPWILAAQEQIGFADERADGVPARSGTASLVSAIVVDQENPPGVNDTAPQGIGCFDDNTGEPEDCESFELQSAQTFTVGVEGMLSFVQTPVSNLSGAGGGEHSSSRSWIWTATPPGAASARSSVRRACPPPRSWPSSGCSTIPRSGRASTSARWASA